MWVSAADLVNNMTDTVSFVLSTPHSNRVSSSTYNVKMLPVPPGITHVF